MSVCVYSRLVLCWWHEKPFYKTYFLSFRLRRTPCTFVRLVRVHCDRSYLYLNIRLNGVPEVMDIKQKSAIVNASSLLACLRTVCDSRSKVKKPKVMYGRACTFVGFIGLWLRFSARGNRLRFDAILKCYWHNSIKWHPSFRTSQRSQFKVRSDVISTYSFRLSSVAHFRYSQQ